MTKNSKSKGGLSAATIILPLLLLGGIGLLVFLPGGDEQETGIMEYVYVNKVVEDPAAFAGREFKVHGRVVPGTIRQKKNSSGDYRFEIEYEGERLKVHFTDMVPDTFAEGGEVVLTGRLNEAGDTVESSVMSAKCPSKYEEENGAMGGAADRGKGQPRS